MDLEIIILSGVNWNPKYAGVANHISDKINFNINITRDKEGHYIMFKE